MTDPCFPKDIRDFKDEKDAERNSAFLVALRERSLSRIYVIQFGFV